jgi:uncharacterized protein
MLSLLFVFLSFGWAQEFEFPNLTEIIHDEARLISRPERLEIQKVSGALYNQGKAQLAILTVPTIGNETIETAALKVAEKWKLGTAQQDNGVLILVARDERKIRIEVGQGLEGDLPDVVASRIIREQMIPFFKKGQFSEGILMGASAVAYKLDPQLVPQDLNFEIKNWANWIGNQMPFIMLLFFIFGSLLSRILRGAIPYHSSGYRSRHGGWGGGGFGGGGFGGGGGGWSGGGGGFSGGGASGGW